MTTSDTTVGDLLRRARDAHGLTAREVGRMIDAGESQISKWETGIVNPGGDVLLRYELAGLLEITVTAKVAA